ncbi:MAG: hypothetical protein ACUVWN_12910 [bacterium]
MITSGKFNTIAIIIFIIFIFFISGCYTKVGYTPNLEDRISEERKDIDRWESYTYREYYYPFYFDYYDFYFPYYWYPRYWYKPLWYFWDDYYYVPEKKPEIRQRDSINSYFNERRNESLRKQDHNRGREKSSEDDSSKEINDQNIRQRRNP